MELKHHEYVLIRKARWREGEFQNTYIGAYSTFAKALVMRDIEIIRWNGEGTKSDFGIYKEVKKEGKGNENARIILGVGITHAQRFMP